MKEQERRKVERIKQKGGKRGIRREGKTKEEEEEEEGGQT